MQQVIIRNVQTCDNCQFSSLHYCAKYQQSCTSMYLDSKQRMIACADCNKKQGFEYGTYQPNKIDQKIGYFHVPGVENIDIFTTLIKMKENYPEAFYENRQIVEIYGAFPGAIWNGRTPNFQGQVFSVEKLESMRNQIEKLGISLNLTWNNSLVNETDIYDRFCNTITKVFHNGKHSITVASQTLFNYLKEKYPNYKYYQSVIATEDDANFVAKDPRYDMFLMNRNLNNNWDELLKVPKEDRFKFEFLCNDACTPICKRSVHYTIGNSALLERREMQNGLDTYCSLDHDFLIYNVDKWPITITPEDIDKYIENDYVHFKLCSRGDTHPVIAFKTIRYLVKPAYWGDAIGWCSVRQVITETERRNKK